MLLFAFNPLSLGAISPDSDQRAWYTQTFSILRKWMKLNKSENWGATAYPGKTLVARECELPLAAEIIGIWKS